MKRIVSIVDRNGNMKLTEEQKLANKIARQKAKKEAKIEKEINSEKNQPAVKELLITIEWKKSRMWGSNPHAEVAVTFQKGDNSYGRFERKDGYTASGCGYDKESTVIARIFNDFLKYKLWNKSIEQCRRKDYKWKEENGAPYGVSAGSYKDDFDISVEYRYFDGGIGSNCYYAISEFLGGKFEHLACGKTFDVYKYTDNES